MRAALQLHKKPPVRTEGLDAIKYLYPFLGSLISKTYVEIIKHTPQIWDFLYDNPDIAEVTRELRQMFSFMDTPRLKALLTQHRPDIFVCTHAVPSSLIAEQKRRGNCHLPLVAIVTDYDVHSYWAHSEVDCYIVANEQSRATLISRGIQENKIKICGIPVNPSFLKKISRKDARKRLGLDPQKPTVLVMGGGRGLGPIGEMMNKLGSLKPDLQVIVVAGTNRELEKDLLPHKRNRLVRVFGFTDQIPLLMDASDILVTKPGGLTSSEALVKGLPMLMINPIPGQEERNARYLAKHAGAQKVKNLKDLEDKVRNLLRHPDALSNLSKKMLKISKPRAAQDAAGEILRLLPAEAFHAHAHAD